jgi:hypothetical protein
VAQLCHLSLREKRGGLGRGGRLHLTVGRCWAPGHLWRRLWGLDGVGRALAMGCQLCPLDVGRQVLTWQLLTWHLLTWLLQTWLR